MVRKLIAHRRLLILLLKLGALLALTKRKILRLLWLSDKTGTLVWELVLSLFLGLLFVALATFFGVTRAVTVHGVAALDPFNLFLNFLLRSRFRQLLASLVLRLAHHELTLLFEHQAVGALD